MTVRRRNARSCWLWLANACFGLPVADFVPRQWTALHRCWQYVGGSGRVLFWLLTALNRRLMVMETEPGCATNRVAVHVARLIQWVSYPYVDWRVLWIPATFRVRHQKMFPRVTRARRDA